MAIQSDEDALTLAVKSLLQAANYAVMHAQEQPEDEEGDEVANYYIHHADILRKLADDWKPPEDGWGKVVPLRAPGTMKALPPDRGRRES